MTTARMYGMTVEADFDLHQPGYEGDGPADVSILTGEPFDDWPEVGAGDVLLQFELHGPWYTLTDTGEHLHFRVHGVCDYTIDRDLRRVELRMHRGAAPGMDSVMTTGTLLSLMLYLRGRPVLHGSAVEVDGVAIGFIGHSGQGKTTLATVLCAEGASIVTDDVLVGELRDGGVVVRRGSAELRLRSGTESLVDALEGRVDSDRLSADARRVVAPGATRHDALPLRALVIPHPTRDGSPFGLRRLPKAQASVVLLGYPRLMGWQDPAVVEANFRHAVAVADAVPVLVADVPWGPPFPDGLGDAILAAVAEPIAVAPAGEEVIS